MRGERKLSEMLLGGGAIFNLNRGGIILLITPVASIGRDRIVPSRNYVESRRGPLIDSFLDLFTLVILPEFSCDCYTGD